MPCRTCKFPDSDCVCPTIHIIKLDATKVDLEKLPEQKMNPMSSSYIKGYKACLDMINAAVIE